MSFIGEEFAKEHGFTQYCHSADRLSVTYMDDDGIFLEVFYAYNGVDLEGTLNFMHKMMTCKIGKFSIPNSNFGMFYRQMCTAKYKLNQDM